MQKSQSDQIVVRRYSVRASITLWMVLAGLFWVSLGLAVTYASHWGSSEPMEAAGHRLSTIAPAAGGQTPPKQ